MKKSKINAIVNIASFLTLLLSILSGLILHQILSGGGGFHNGKGLRAGYSFLGMTRYQWTTVHYHSSLFFLLLILTNLVSHWNDIRGYIKDLPNTLRGK